MIRFILVLVICLGLSSFSFAQEQDSLQVQREIQEDEMVCFLTDANTITCFVAPENLPKEEQGNQTEDNLYENQGPGNDVLNDDDDYLDEENKQFEDQREGPGQGDLYKIEEEEQFDGKEVKMI